MYRRFARGEGGGRVNRYILKLNEDNSCKAYKDGKCTIYNFRPMVCRLYPFYFDPFSGVFIHKDCCGDFKKYLQENKLEILKMIKARVDYFIDLESKQ